MQEYKKMYLDLFNSITDAISAIDEIRAGLVQAQQQAEERFIALENEEIPEAAK